MRDQAISCYTFATTLCEVITNGQNWLEYYAARKRKTTMTTSNDKRDERVLLTGASPPITSYTKPSLMMCRTVFDSLLTRTLN